jgi:putative acetyltransferase
MNIFQATSTEQLQAIRELFQEYAAWLQVDLCFQGFAKELAELPGLYALPSGRVLLAVAEGQSAGCVALRPIDEKTCEMKRLYVRPAHQGKGLGRALASRLVSEAQTIGYSTMVLDTLPHMMSAVRLYESLGFLRRGPYYETPLENTVFMELRLAPEKSRASNRL